MDHFQKEKDRIEGFVRISRYAGMREDLVQAGGGNSAVKLSEHRMLIKASGFQMADISPENGYAVVDPSLIREFFRGRKDRSETPSEEEERKILTEALVEGGRPSIETFLHSISGTYTLHTHPVVVNAFTCRENWTEELMKAFPDAMYVPYAKPGIQLAMTYYAAAEACMDRELEIPDVVFLQNHGLLVSGETADAVIEKTEQTLGQLEEMLGCRNDGCHGVTELWKLFPERIVWQVTDRKVLDAYREAVRERYRFFSFGDACLFY